MEFANEHKFASLLQLKIYNESQLQMQYPGTKPRHVDAFDTPYLDMHPRVVTSLLPKGNEPGTDREYHGFTYPPWVVGRVHGVGVRVRKFVPSPYPYPRDGFMGFDGFFPRV